MVIFFFVVGLEIKYELVNGDLRDPRTAALPIVAAIGGMLVPAGLYVLIAGGGDGRARLGHPDGHRHRLRRRGARRCSGDGSRRRCGSSC